MKNKLLWVTVLFAAVIVMITGLFYFAASVQSHPGGAEQVVALNEIDQLVKAGNNELAREKIAALEKMIRNTEFVEQGKGKVLAIGAVSLVFLAVVSLYLYFEVLRPFEKLQGFADSIARGNFDVPLKYERTNYFGKFTWAFDSMRNEITKARRCEKEAVENN